MAEKALLEVIKGDDYNPNILEIIFYSNFAIFGTSILTLITWYISYSFCGDKKLNNYVLDINIVVWILACISFYLFDFSCTTLLYNLTHRDDVLYEDNAPMHPV